MRTRARLNPYERSIVDALVGHFGYRADAARQLVVQYIDIVRKLGGYDHQLVQAERLVQAIHAGYTPEAWLARIQTVEKAAAKDPGIPHLERTAYASNR